MAYLRSISDEYDDHGNYIGDSPDGNAFHGVESTQGEKQLMCSGCGSTKRREHGGGGTCCADCGCSEAQWKHR